MSAYSSLRSSVMALSSTAILCLSAAWAVENADDPVFDVPRVGAIAIDGNLADWNGAGLNIMTLTSSKGAPWPKATLPPTAVLGWNESGLLVGVTVHHREANEHDYVRHLFKGDSIEVFCAPRKGSRDRYMLVVSPGLDPKYPQPRHCFFADPAEEAERDLSQLSFQFGRQKTEDGYTAELLLPWSNLNVTPKPGLETALQIYVMESDDGEKSKTAMWHPAGESHVDPYAAHRIRLVERSDAKPVTLSASAQDDVQRNARTVRIIGVAEHVGKRYEVHSENGMFVGALLARGTQAYAALDLESRQSCTVFVEKQPVPVVQLPAEDTLPVVMANLECRFKQCVFASDAFPEPYLENARNYRIVKTEFYDAAFNPVPAPQQPGRYGTVVHISDAKDKVTTRRFRTLFKVPPQLGTWTLETDKIETLARRMADDPQIAELARRTLTAAPSEFARALGTGGLKQSGALSDPSTAALLACAYERERGLIPKDSFSEDARIVDRQWWVTLKRKLYGTDKRFSQPVLYPRPMEGPAAPVLRPGTCAEAGMKPETIDKLDAICKAGVEASGEPVSVCLARHGVIFFHRAYGETDGAPMAVDTKCSMQSITKPLSGALLMMLVDLKLADVDDPVAKFLPQFRDKVVKTPLTLHNLYTHTNGLNGIWGDEMHDTEEVVGAFYPVMDVGNYSYNSVGFALGSKIVEQISGEALPLFAKRHLLEPLGMHDTDCICSGHGARSTALDYARFGQMLLNKGTYGNLRFFSGETFAAMLPVAGPWAARGIGIMWMEAAGLGAGTFGHTSGNSAVFRVDPVHDLVLVVNSAGREKKFAACWPQFFAAIVQGVDDSADRTSHPLGPNAQEPQK